MKNIDNYVPKTLEDYNRLYSESVINPETFWEKIAETFLESKSKFIQSELFAKPSKVGLASPFHQDNFYWAVKGSNALTVWVAFRI